MELSVLFKSKEGGVGLLLDLSNNNHKISLKIDSWNFGYRAV
jgi:hypothetical protein